MLRQAPKFTRTDTRFPYTTRFRSAEIVGARYAGVSAPESLRFPHGERSGGTLTLVVRGAHAAMMQHITPEIVERVNRFFGYGAVARVTIRQGEVAVAKPRVAPPSQLGRASCREGGCQYV